jgi:hypothetical protein
MKITFIRQVSFAGPMRMFPLVPSAIQAECVSATNDDGRAAKDPARCEGMMVSAGRARRPVAGPVSWKTPSALRRRRVKDA